MYINLDSQRADKFSSTSPSVYLQLVGPVSLTDQCGTDGFDGLTLTDPFVAIPSDQLFTYKFPYYTEGQQWYDPNGIIGANFVGEASPLNVADLACPTFGLGIGSRSGRPYTTVGPPYLPLIVPPPQILSLDPGWMSACKGFLSYAPGLSSFAIFDPPRTLETATNLVPDPAGTPASTAAEVTPTNTIASGMPVLQPGQDPSSNFPDPTSIPNIVADPHVPTAGTPNPQDSQSRDSGTTALPSIDPNPSKDESIDTGIPSDYGEDSIDYIASASRENPSHYNPQSPGGQHSGNSPGSPETMDDPLSLVVTSGVEGLIFIALSDNIPNKPTQASSVFIVADQKFAANPTGFNVAGSQILPDKPAITLSGTSISLGSSGMLVIGTSTVQLPKVSAASGGVPNDWKSPTFVFAVGGQTFTASPTSFQIAGSPVLSGHAPVTISGTRISLGSSGALVIWTSSFQLPLPTLGSDVEDMKEQTLDSNPSRTVDATVTPVPSQNEYTGPLAVGSLLLTAVSGFAVAMNGRILQAGDPAVIVDGTKVDLGMDGKIAVGTAMFAIPRSADPRIQYPSPLTIGGLIFIPLSGSTLLIDGKILRPGDPATIIDGTSISLGPSGDIVVGTLSTTIPTGAYSKLLSQSPLTIGDLTLTRSGSALIVDGKTLWAGDLGTTIDGVRVSLGEGGSLVIGSSSTPIPTGAPSGTASAQSSKSGQRRNTSISRLGKCVAIPLLAAFSWF